MTCADAEDKVRFACVCSDHTYKGEQTMRHVMSPLDFTTDELEQLFNLAADIEKNPQKYAHKCDGKKLATCFYEPSTRTRLSFESAMINLGGQSYRFFRCRLPLPLPREKAFPIRSALFPVLQISAPCAIQRKVRRWSQLHIPASRSSTPVMADISILPRH